MWYLSQYRVTDVVLITVQGTGVVFIIVRVSDVVIYHSTGLQMWYLS